MSIYQVYDELKYFYRFIQYFSKVCLSCRRCLTFISANVEYFYLKHVLLHVLSVSSEYTAIPAVAVFLLVIRTTVETSVSPGILFGVFILGDYDGGLWFFLYCILLCYNTE